ncbi:MAG: methyltransferase [Oscillospiraceae bacterium]|jgi:tRNA1(Val) A37 N6-methylase TrmN6|nr:methyltransferase [Oscillospiraceae bacterium]
MFETEELADGFKVYISESHRFGTDAFLLANFAALGHNEVVLDLCAGCGIVGFLLFLTKNPKLIHAVEVQKEAVDLMRRTVEENKLTNFDVRLADLRDLDSNAFHGGNINLIVCNPPYKAEFSGLLSKRGDVAIARHEVMCTIDDICKVASRLLGVGGRLCLCQRSERLVDTLVTMRANKIEPKRIRFVSFKMGRSPWLFLVEGRRSGRPFLKIDPPLFLEADSRATPELLGIYGKL